MRRRRGPKVLAIVASGAFVASTVAAGAGAASAGPAKPPRDVQVTDVGPTSATVEWSRPQGKPEDHLYRVELSHGAGHDFTFTDEQVVTLGDLRPAETYQVRVEVAFSEVWSDPVEFTTVDVPVPPTPVDVQATTGAGTVTVEWQPSVADGKEPDAYVVRWSPDSRSQRVTETSVTREFPAGAPLTVTVAARDDELDYESEPSDPVEIAVPPANWESLPAPTNLEAHTDGDTVVSFEWDAIESDGVVTYDVRKHFASDDPALSMLIADAGASTTVDATLIGELSSCPPNVPAGQKWVVWVLAHSDGETSPPSNTVEVCTL